MYIAFTESAVGEINRVWSPQTGGQLKLVFDSEGCGCAVNGVPTLWIVDQAGPNDLTIEGDPYTLKLDPKHEVFFEDQMKVDFISDGLRFVLKSSNQIYNAHMSLIDKRGVVLSK